mgnify:CR=1 FL=1
METSTPPKKIWLKLGYSLQILLHTGLIGVVGYFMNIQMKFPLWEPPQDFELSYYVSFVGAGMYSIGLCSATYKQQQQKINLYFLSSTIVFFLGSCLFFIDHVDFTVMGTRLYCILGCLVQIGFAVAWLGGGVWQKRMSHRIKLVMLLMAGFYLFLILLLNITIGSRFGFSQGAGLLERIIVFMITNLFVNWGTILILQLFRIRGIVGSFFSLLAGVTILLNLYLYSSISGNQIQIASFDVLLYASSAIGVLCSLSLFWQYRQVQSPYLVDNELLDDFGETLNN